VNIRGARQWHFFAIRMATLFRCAPLYREEMRGEHPPEQTGRTCHEPCFFLCQGPQISITMVKSILLGLATLVALRLAALPSQLNHTPYHDDTVGADLLRLIFLSVPGWVFAGSGCVFLVAVLLSRRTRRAPAHHFR
jgi:hypothetical protein